jgi:hypothetical protein
MGLHIFNNLDKEDWERDEQWRNKYDPRDPNTLLNFPTCKMLLVARPNSGKTNWILNMILHQIVDFDNIVILHHDPDTREYDQIVDGERIVLTTKIPTANDFPVGMKNLCVIDDYYTGKLNPADTKLLNKLFTYISSHRHCHVILSCQDYTTVPTTIRRSCDVYVLWKMVDYERQKLLAKKFGIKQEGLYEIFNNPQIIKSKFDCLVVDLLPGAPAKYRINGIEPLPDDLLDGNDEIEDKIAKRKGGKAAAAAQEDAYTIDEDGIRRYRRK